MPASDATLTRLFLDGRTFSHWLDRPVADEQLQQLYHLMSLGPTSANCGPARIVFVASTAQKARLLPALDEGNRAKTLAAPVTAVIGYDLEFARELSTLFPHEPDAAGWFADPEHARTTAFRNGSLQGGYFILAARAVGLDCGPMSGFDAAAVDALYFKGTSMRSNFLCNLGYGDRSRLHPRHPRLPFERACRVV